MALYNLHYAENEPSQKCGCDSAGVKKAKGIQQATIESFLLEGTPNRQEITTDVNHIIKLEVMCTESIFVFLTENLAI